METFEKTLEKNYIYEGKILKLRKDKAQLPNGKECSREIVEHNGGAGAFCVLNDGRIILVKQFRYAYQKELLEIPAGKLEKDEDPLDCVKREIEEETGYIADKIEFLGQIYPTPGYTTEVIYLYKASELRPGKMNLDEGEFINLVILTKEELQEKIENNEIKDAKTIIGFLRSKI